MGYFSANEVDELSQGRVELAKQYHTLRGLFIIRKFTSDRAREYAVEGFCRRLEALKISIDRVFDVLPPAQEEIPARANVLDATMAIHSFIINAFGCLDNLAWIWVYEKNVKGKGGKDLDRKQVSLGSKHVAASFTPKFQSYIESRKDWFENLKDFRDALSHRIPLYIPPYIIDEKSVDDYKKLEIEASKAKPEERGAIRTKQQKLGRFRPWMTHSLFEQAPSIVFHRQLLQDYVTIDEFARTALQELDAEQID